MKGPGLRIDVDVRRAWRCPVCGQSARLAMDVTAPRCPCVRDGVPMKLAEGQRPGRLDLRPELRSMLDRIQGGEEFARLTSPLTSDSEGAPRDGGSGGHGGAKARNRPPRPERSDGADRPPRGPRPSDSQHIDREGAAPAEPRAVANTANVEAPTVSPVPRQEPVAPPPRPPVPQEDDDFGAGLGDGETSAPQ